MSCATYTLPARIQRFYVFIYASSNHSPPTKSHFPPVSISARPATPRPRPHFPQNLPRLSHRLINSLSRISDIARVQAGHADAAVLGHVDVGVLAEAEHLGLGQAGEAEHADLLGDVLPAAGAAVEVLEDAAQGGAHFLDAAAHGAQVVFPLGEEGLVVEDGAGDAGAVGGRVADLGSLQDGQLRGDAADGAAGVRTGSGHEVEGACALAVQAEVLGEGLGDAELETLGNKVPHCPGVVLEAPGCEALVGAVEEGKVVLCADGFGELDPLVVGEVDAGRVVSTGMQEDDATRRRLLNGRYHAREVKAFGLRGEIGVGFYREIDIGKNLVVVGPCWGGEVDGLIRGAGIEFGEE